MNSNCVLESAVVEIFIFLPFPNFVVRASSFRDLIALKGVCFLRLIHRDSSMPGVFS